jgi:RNA polymerase sigma-70 factor (ECF subfamily)
MSTAPRIRDRKRKDAALFELFYRTHFQSVSRYVLRRLPLDSHDDVVASVFVVAWKKFDSNPEPSLPWLYRIASFEVAHERRRLARQPKTESVRDVDVVSVQPSLDDNELGLSLRQLSKGDVELLRLLFVEELSREDAAMVLGCTTGTLSVRLHRARARLVDTMHRISWASIESEDFATEAKEVP